MAKKKDESNLKPEETLLPAQEDDELELDEMWSFVLKNVMVRNLANTFCITAHRVIKAWKHGEKQRKVSVPLCFSGKWVCSPFC